jgi:hypothetical protein
MGSADAIPAVSKDGYYDPVRALLDTDPGLATPIQHVGLAADTRGLVRKTQAGDGSAEGY